MCKIQKSTMLIKKTPKADLEKNRSLYILLGYVMAIALLYVCLEWRSGGFAGMDLFDDDEYVFREDFVPITWEIPPEAETPEVPPVQVVAPTQESPSTLSIDESNIRIVENTDEEPEEALTKNDSILLANLSERTNSSEDKKEKEEEITSNADLEKMPEFPGGIAALRAYLYRALIYPQEAVKQRKEGTVLCTFIITERGKAQDVKILQGQTPEMDIEAIRVIMQMPYWRPGIKKGKPTSVRYVMPIVFRLH